MADSKPAGMAITKATIMDARASSSVAGGRSNTSGIAAQLIIAGEERPLDSKISLTLYRVAQEGLTNIRKHARAHTVRVLLRCRPGGSYMLLVEDDGVGFEGTMPKGKPGEHIGLSIMQERAFRMGGELRIESEPGEGTRVEMVYSPRSRHEGERDARIAY